MITLRSKLFAIVQLFQYDLHFNHFRFRTKPSRRFGVTGPYVLVLGAGLFTLARAESTKRKRSISENRRDEKKHND